MASSEMLDKVAELLGTVAITSPRARGSTAKRDPIPAGATVEEYTWVLRYTVSVSYEAGRRTEQWSIDMTLLLANKYEGDEPDRLTDEALAFFDSVSAIFSANIGLGGVAGTVNSYHTGGIVGETEVDGAIWTSLQVPLTVFREVLAGA